eukprot:TRINITY_DN313_c0_g1_i4.p1 TRINITY_DN313_c0_g1~~TRINITY_DN313_c0_g1_i4.p1  ORF type:complete len:2688 (+),score=780.94 TRINITY_DN313_c0_g1_i4:6139-14202(+)
MKAIAQKQRRQEEGKDDDADNGMADLLKMLRDLFGGRPYGALGGEEKKHVDDILASIQRKQRRQQSGTDHDADDGTTDLTHALKGLLGGRPYGAIAEPERKRVESLFGSLQKKQKRQDAGVDDKTSGMADMLKALQDMVGGRAEGAMLPDERRCLDNLMEEVTAKEARHDAGEDHDATTGYADLAKGLRQALAGQTYGTLPASSKAEVDEALAAMKIHGGVAEIDRPLTSAELSDMIAHLNAAQTVLEEKCDTSPPEEAERMLDEMEQQERLIQALADIADAKTGGVGWPDAEAFARTLLQSGGYALDSINTSGGPHDATIARALREGTKLASSALAQNSEAPPETVAAVAQLREDTKNVLHAKRDGQPLDASDRVLALPADRIEALRDAAYAESPDIAVLLEAEAAANRRDPARSRAFFQDASRQDELLGELQKLKRSGAGEERRLAEALLQDAEKARQRRDGQYVPSGPDERATKRHAQLQQALKAAADSASNPHLATMCGTLQEAAAANFEAGGEQLAAMASSAAEAEALRKLLEKSRLTGSARSAVQEAAAAANDARVKSMLARNERLGAGLHGAALDALAALQDADEDLLEAGRGDDDAIEERMLTREEAIASLDGDRDAAATRADMVDRGDADGLEAAADALDALVEQLQATAANAISSAETAVHKAAGAKLRRAAGRLATEAADTRAAASAIRRGRRTAQTIDAAGNADDAAGMDWAALQELLAMLTKAVDDPGTADAEGLAVVQEVIEEQLETQTADAAANQLIEDKRDAILAVLEDPELAGPVRKSLLGELRRMRQAGVKDCDPPPVPAADMDLSDLAAALRDALEHMPAEVLHTSSQEALRSLLDEGDGMVEAVSAGKLPSYAARDRHATAVEALQQDMRAQRAQYAVMPDAFKDHLAAYTEKIRDAAKSSAAGDGGASEATQASVQLAELDALVRAIDGAQESDETQIDAADEEEQILIADRMELREALQDALSADRKDLAAIAEGAAPSLSQQIQTVEAKSAALQALRAKETNPSLQNKLAEAMAGTLRRALDLKQRSKTDPEAIASAERSRKRNAMGDGDGDGDAVSLAETLKRLMGCMDTAQQRDEDLAVEGDDEALARLEAREEVMAKVEKVLAKATAAEDGGPEMDPHEVLALIEEIRKAPVDLAPEVRTALEAVEQQAQALRAKRKPPRAVDPSWDNEDADHAAGRLKALSQLLGALADLSDEDEEEERRAFSLSDKQRTATDARKKHRQAVRTGAERMVADEKSPLPASAAAQAERLHDHRALAKEVQDAERLPEPLKGRFRAIDGRLEAMQTSLAPAAAAEQWMRERASAVSAAATPFARTDVDGALQFVGSSDEAKDLALAGRALGRALQEEAERVSGLLDDGTLRPSEVERHDAMLRHLDEAQDLLHNRVQALGVGQDVPAYALARALDVLRAVTESPITSSDLVPAVQKEMTTLSDALAQRPKGTSGPRLRHMDPAEGAQRLAGLRDLGGQIERLITADESAIDSGAGDEGTLQARVQVAERALGALDTIIRTTQRGGELPASQTEEAIGALKEFRHALPGASPQEQALSLAVGKAVADFGAMAKKTQDAHQKGRNQIGSLLGKLTVEKAALDAHLNDLPVPMKADAQRASERLEAAIGALKPVKKLTDATEPYVTKEQALEVLKAERQAAAALEQALGDLPAEARTHAMAAARDLRCDAQTTDFSIPELPDANSVEGAKALMRKAQSAATGSAAAVKAAEAAAARLKAGEMAKMRQLQDMLTQLEEFQEDDEDIATGNDSAAAAQAEGRLDRRLSVLNLADDLLKSAQRRVDVPTSMAAAAREAELILLDEALHGLSVADGVSANERTAVEERRLAVGELLREVRSERSDVRAVHKGNVAAVRSLAQDMTTAAAADRSALASDAVSDAVKAKVQQRLSAADALVKTLEAFAEDEAKRAAGDTDPRTFAEGLQLADTMERGLRNMLQLADSGAEFASKLDDAVGLARQAKQDLQGAVASGKATWTARLDLLRKLRQPLQAERQAAEAALPKALPHEKDDLRGRVADCDQALESLGLREQEAEGAAKVGFSPAVKDRLSTAKKIDEESAVLQRIKKAAAPDTETALRAHLRQLAQAKEEIKVSVATDVASKLQAQDTSPLGKLRGLLRKAAKVGAGEDAADVLMRIRGKGAQPLSLQQKAGLLGRLEAYAKNQSIDEDVRAALEEEASAFRAQLRRDAPSLLEEADGMRVFGAISRNCEDVLGALRPLMAADEEDRDRRVPGSKGRQQFVERLRHRQKIVESMEELLARIRSDHSGGFLDALKIAEAQQQLLQTAERDRVTYGLKDAPDLVKQLAEHSPLLVRYIDTIRPRANAETEDAEKTLKPKKKKKKKKKKADEDARGPTDGPSGGLSPAAPALPGAATKGLPTALAMLGVRVEDESKATLPLPSAKPDRKRPAPKASLFGALQKRDRRASGAAAADSSSSDDMPTRPAAFGASALRQASGFGAETGGDADEIDMAAVLARRQSLAVPSSSEEEVSSSASSDALMMESSEEEEWVAEFKKSAADGAFDEDEDVHAGMSLEDRLDQERIRRLEARRQKEDADERERMAILEERLKSNLAKAESDAIRAAIEAAKKAADERAAQREREKDAATKKSEKEKDKKKAKKTDNKKSKKEKSKHADAESKKKGKSTDKTDKKKKKKKN